DERVAVLRERAARRDEQIFVLGDGLEERLVQLQRERQRLAHELRVVVSREDVTARRERTRDVADRGLLDRSAAGKREHSQAGGKQAKSRWLGTESHVRA